MQADVVVIAMDRWGRFLLIGDGLPGGAIAAGEAPDGAALRAFEDATGVVLEQLRLYRVLEDDGRRLHVYFDDPDIDAATLPADLDARYLPPERVAEPGLDPVTRLVLEAFLESGAYRALFH